MHYREGGRGEGERERERETDRQTDGRTERERERQTETDRQTEKLKLKYLHSTEIPGLYWNTCTLLKCRHSTEIPEVQNIVGAGRRWRRQRIFEVTVPQDTEGAPGDDSCFLRHQPCNTHTHSLIHFCLPNAPLPIRVIIITIDGFYISLVSGLHRLNALYNILW